MRRILITFKSFLFLLMVVSLALADTSSESTVSSGLSCDDGYTSHSGYFCKSKKGDEVFCSICNTCGDAFQIPDAGEECDDNENNDPLGACNTDCKKTFCGDQLVQPTNGFEINEQCDLGVGNSNTGTCSADCQITSCGDGFIQNPNGEGAAEECDNADANHINAECNTDCQITTCGDQILQQPNGEGVTEQCDSRDFAAGLAIESHICKSDCTSEARKQDFQIKVFFKKIGTDTLIPATEQPGPGFKYQEDFVIVYEVTNTGNAVLSNIIITDDRNSSLSLVSNADGDDFLGVGEQWLYESEVISPELPEQFVVTVSVEATDTDLGTKVILNHQESGYFCDDKESGSKVFCSVCTNCDNDQVTFYYETLPTPGIEIIAYVKINDGEWKSADQLDDLNARATDLIYFKYDVINIGNVPLSGVTVTHTYTNAGETVTETLTLEQRTEAGNGDDILDYQESWTYEAGPVELKEGTFTLTATVTAQDPDGNTISDTIDTEIVIEVGPDVCDYNVFTHGAGAGGFFHSLDEEAQELSCLNQKFGEIFDFENLYDGHTHKAKEGTGRSFCGGYTPITVAAAYNYYGDDCLIAWWDLYGNVDFALDSSCQVVARGDEVDHSRTCASGKYKWVGTPLSLLWNKQSDVNTEITLSSFPIDARLNNKVYQWKASSDTPLLVYDPKHEGKIVSATQLFGNWTFGTRTPYAATNVAMTAEPADDVIWKNGYEALAMLDENADGELNGAELSDLGLWFDHNQNGVSEAGEVQPLVDTGVISLSVIADRVDELGDTYSSIGFTRIDQLGQIISNETVDWVSPAYSSASEALYAMSQSSADLNSNQEYDFPELNNYSSQVDAVKFRKGYLTAWKYDIDHKLLEVESALAQKYNSGLLRLGITQDGEVFGFTLSEMPVESKINNAKSLIRNRELTGKLVADNQIEFTVQLETGAVLKTTAKLTDENHLEAKTSVYSNSKNGTEQAFSYSWIAKRIK